MGLNRTHAVVIGAGIGGLAVALALRRFGAEVTVLEQAEAITEVGAGLQISPNGAVVLDALGLGERFRACSITARAVVLRDYRGTSDVLRLDLAKHDPDRRYAFVHRADLIDLLADAVRDAGVEVRLLQKVAQVHPGQTPSVEMQNAARLAGDLVIGADGLQSRARVALNGADAPFFTGQVAWRALVPGPAQAEALLYMGPGRHVVTYPLRDGTLRNIVAVQERTLWAEEGWHHRDDPENLRGAFADFGPEVQSLLAEAQEPRLWGLFRHPVAGTWYRDGVALVGDAAHPTLPFLAQGANLALEDAWVLASCAAQGQLDAYQDRRQARARRVIAAANGNAWKYHLRFPPLRAAGHLGLRAVGRMAPAAMVRSFDWLYGHDVTV